MAAGSVDVSLFFTCPLAVEMDIAFVYFYVKTDITVDQLLSSVRAM